MSIWPPGPSAARRPQGDFGGGGPVGNSGAGPGAGGDGADFPNVFGISYIGVVEPERRGRRQARVPRLRGQPPLPPRSCPRPSRGFTTQPDGTQVGLFTTRSIASAGPAFRVRATKIEGRLQRRHLRAGADAGRPDQHPAHAVPDRARRHGRRHRLRARRGLVAGPARPAPAGGRRAHRRLHRGGEPRPAGPGRRPADRGGPAGPGAQRHARTDPGRVRGPARLRGPPEGERATLAPVRRRRLARASHADRRRVGLRRALRARRGRALRRPAARRCRGSAPRRRAWTAWSTTCSPWPGWTRACRWSRRPSSWCRWRRRRSTRPPPSAPSGRCGSGPRARSRSIGDKDRLRQVIDNLLANVRAHTPPGTTTTVRVDQVGDRGGVRGPRRRARHAGRGGAPRLRAVLPGRPRTIPHQRGQRARPFHRRGHRRRAWRQRRRCLLPGVGHDSHRADPAERARARRQTRPPASTPESAA